MPVSEAMTDDEVWQLIFAPGFSTAEAVTDVSGRGVGMDVVKRNIHEMGGHVEIALVQGQGTTIRIVLPLTLAILNGMSVKVGEEVYILPLNYVIESLQPMDKDVHSITADEHVMHVRGEYLALLELHKLVRRGRRGGRSPRRASPSSCSPRARASRCWSTSSWASTRWWSRTWKPTTARCRAFPARPSWATATSR
jgi:chemotaxis protein histidine kinase CheA